MRNLSMLWAMVLEQFLKGETAFICNCINRMNRETIISKLEGARLAQDLYRLSQDSYGKTITETMRQGTYGALWERTERDARIKFIESRITDNQKQEESNVEFYM